MGLLLMDPGVVLWSAVAFFIVCAGMYVLMHAIELGVIVWRKR